MPSKKARKGRNPALERHFGLDKGNSRNRMGMIGTAGYVVGSTQEYLAPVRLCPAHPCGSQDQAAADHLLRQHFPTFPQRSDGDNG